MQEWSEMMIIGWSILIVMWLYQSIIRAINRNWQQYVKYWRLIPLFLNTLLMNLILIYWTIPEHLSVHNVLSEPWQEICNLVSPLNPSFINAIIDKKMIIASPIKKFTENVSNLIVLSNRNTRIIVQSVLASSFEQKFIQNFLRIERNHYCQI